MAWEWKTGFRVADGGGEDAVDACEAAVGGGASETFGRAEEVAVAHGHRVRDQERAAATARRARLEGTLSLAQI